MSGPSEPTQGRSERPRGVGMGGRCGTALETLLGRSGGSLRIVSAAVVAGTVGWIVSGVGGGPPAADAMRVSDPAPVVVEAPSPAPPSPSPCPGVTSGLDPSPLLVELAGGTWPGSWIDFYEQDGCWWPMPNLTILDRIETLDETTRVGLAAELELRIEHMAAQEWPTAPGVEGERIRAQTIQVELAYLEAAQGR